MEDHGDKYFDELLSRSFFQSSSSNRSRFVMHDLVHALAKSIAGDTCLHLDDELWNDLQCPISENTRHSSFIRHFCDIFKKFESNKVLEELIPKLGHLRVLSLARYTISEIPDSLTLKLSCCKELIRLPISIGNLINLRHLDVAGAIRLQEMPIQIGKLKDLRILSNFIVDKNNGLTIKGLKDMSHLRGELCISKLENVVNIQDARDVDLKLKRNLESLIMQWSSELDGSGNERNQMDVLDSLQPCLNLNKLCIQFYGGPEFPRWIRDALFSKMVDLSLIDCRKCTSLPCLGQLPSLKQLRIQRMDGHVRMGALEDWSSSTESLFPCLHELIIEYCPKLIMKLPTYLPSLTKLSVHFCPKLESPLSRLPLLKKLQVRQCNEAVLSKLTISEISGLIKLHEGFVQVLQGLRVLKYRNAKNSYICGRMVLDRKTLILLRLEIVTNLDCPKLASFPDVGFPPKLRSLTVGNCKGLKSLPDGMMLKMRNDSTDSNNLCLLECLSIWNCPSLICFPKGQLPTTLKSLRIKFCDDLKSLPEGMMGMCALEELTIVRLKSLPEGIMHQHSTNAAALQALEICTCPSLTSFPRGYPNLKTLPDWPQHPHISSYEDSENLELLLPQIKKPHLSYIAYHSRLREYQDPPIPMGSFQTHLS
ncbi:putative disease resistance protein [Vitis vinifera]|uniref:Putative disease resistance protein n=1 Tax=Vitis vinifera TaxID=29760 RepID=A0A438FRU4_VITVI|nr:putative disease resistance protein [Vitis vinifera]